MAAFITYKNSNNSMNIQEWHKGEHLQMSPTSIQAIQADGDELELIKKAKLVNVPMLEDARVVAWYGDDAKFIVHNVFHRVRFPN